MPVIPVDLIGDGLPARRTGQRQNPVIVEIPGQDTRGAGLQREVLSARTGSALAPRRSRSCHDRGGGDMQDISWAMDCPRAVRWRDKLRDG